MGLWFCRFEWTKTLQLIDRMLKVGKKRKKEKKKPYWCYFISCQGTIEG
jgi:hypothetical protein